MIKVTHHAPRQWFHGSPERLDTLRAGSWVTPFRELAKAFSHRPTRISASDSDFTKVRHDGKIAGLLYVVAESLEAPDLEELPGTDQTHWKTMRVLKVQLIEEVLLVDAEMLSDAESAALAERFAGTGYWRREENE